MIRKEFIITHILILYNFCSFFPLKYFRFTLDLSQEAIFCMLYKRAYSVSISKIVYGIHDGTFTVILINENKKKINYIFTRPHQIFPL